METMHTVHNCRWGIPTVLFRWPEWYEVTEHEWSCTRGGTAHVLVDADVCHECPHWEPGEDEPETAAPITAS